MTDAGKYPVEVTFVAGPERDLQPAKPVGPAILAAGLSHRLAIVQHTYVEGRADMVFAADLWISVASFLSEQEETAVFVCRRAEDFGRDEIPLAAFCLDWDEEGCEERAPPDVLLSRKHGLLQHCVVTEPWANVGGPDRYHDSWTYAVYSANSLEEALPRFLRKMSEGRWKIADTVDPAPQKKKAPWWGPLKSLMLGS